MMPKTVTICGSMRFSEEMKEIAFRLETERGWNVLQCVYSPPDADLSTKDLAVLTKLHYCKIDLSDGIYVVNVGGYIGSSAAKEIAYAREAGKEVIYHYPIKA